MGQGDRSPSPVAHVRAPVPPVPVFSGLSGRLEGQLSNLAASTFRLGDRSPAANATTAVDGAAYISVINNSLSSNSLAIHSLTRHADSSRQGNASVVETAQLAQRFDNTMATIKNLAASITKPPLPPGQPAPPPEDKASEKPSAEQAEKRRAATARRSSMEAPPPPPPQASSSQPPRGAGAAPMRSISASASRGSGPRGLVLKLEKYRNDPLALEELHRRAKEQQEERLQQSMRRTSGQAVNFVAENRRALGMPADMGLVAMVIGGGSAGMSTASLDALKREVPLLASLSRNRPANGGSPTSRAEFLAERVIRTTEQRARSKSAKTRAESHLGAMLAQREQLGSKWEEWRAAQERKQAEEEAAMKRRKQQETWATVVALGSRLSALRNQARRQSRPLLTVPSCSLLVP